jgi:hypothetical protein
VKDNIKQFLQVVLILLGPLLIKHHISFGNDIVDEVAGTLSDAWGIIWKFMHWNKTPDAPAPVSNPSVSGGQSGFARFSLVLFTAALSAIVFVFIIVGCAHVEPGQDPIIVNAERVQTIATPTFDILLETDNANREFWQSKASAFHDFCEWLRERQTAELADGTITNVQRAIALQLNLDKVKLDYKASKVSSNAVIEVTATLKSIERQANAWLLIVTNPVPLNVTP